MKTLAAVAAATLALVLSACQNPVPPERMAVESVGSARVPQPGDTVRIVHPSNDARYGEFVALLPDGSVSVDRSGEIRTGTWRHDTCGLFSRPCTVVESVVRSGVVLRYELYEDGSMDATPSQNTGWRWNKASSGEVLQN